MPEESMTVWQAPASDLSVQRFWTRWKLLGLVIVIGSLGLSLGLIVAYFALVHAAQKELNNAIAETDRLDPGWRLDEIQVRRDADVILEEEDASAVVFEVLALMPEDW